jgi:Asp/Glu/hydantoin racemase
VSPTQHRPDGQNPIAFKASPENAAQAWLQHVAPWRRNGEASNIVTIGCCTMRAITFSLQRNIHDVVTGAANREVYGPDGVSPPEPA